MPVGRVKRGECPGESLERNPAVHHWIFLDIRGVIQSDELMPDDLRVNPKRHCRQGKQNDEIRSPECRSVAGLECFPGSSLGYGGNRSSFLGCLPGHCGL